MPCCPAAPLARLGLEEVDENWVAAVQPTPTDPILSCGNTPLRTSFIGVEVSSFSSFRAL